MKKPLSQAQREQEILLSSLRVAAIQQALSGPAVPQRSVPREPRRGRGRLRARNRNPIRRLDRFIIRMTPGFLRPPLPNYLSLLTHCVNELELLHKRHSEWFPSLQAQLRELEEARYQREMRAALAKVYGLDRAPVAWTQADQNQKPVKKW